MKSKESELEKTARTIRYLIYGMGLMFLGLLLLATFPLVIEWYIQSTMPAPKIGVPVLKIENVSTEYDSYGSTIDEVKIRVRNITIKNVGNASLDSQEITFEVVVRGVKSSVEVFVSIKSNGTYSLPGAYLDELSLSIERYPGEYEYVGTLYLKDGSGKVLDKKGFSVSIPTAKIGDTVLVRMRDGRKFDLTLNSWRIEPNRYSKNEVDVVINVTIKNSYSRTEEDTPDLGGVIMTERGYVYGYQTSHFYCPTPDNPYGPCPLSLLPGESFTGELRIEGIPKDWKPVELSIFCLYGDVKEIIVLGDQNGQGS